MAGPFEEIGKIATAFMNIMRAQPFLLTSIVMNLALLGVLVYVIQSAIESRRVERDALYKAQSETQELIARCHLPPLPNEKK